jgi:hypothetical protein
MTQPHMAPAIGQAKSEFVILGEIIAKRRPPAKFSEI